MSLNLKLLTLPAELKKYIYQYALTIRPIADPASQAPQPFLGPADPTNRIAVSKHAVSLLFTCRSIYAEAYNVYIQVNTFLIQQKPDSQGEVSFLMKHATLIRNVAVELYLEDLVWLAGMDCIQACIGKDGSDLINAGSTFYVPGLKAMKYFKAALLPLTNVKNVHILLKGWSRDKMVMPFRFSTKLSGSDWTLDESAFRIGSLVDKWMEFVLVEEWFNKSDTPNLTVQLDASFTDDEHDVFEAVWEDSYRCMKTVCWV